MKRISHNILRLNRNVSVSLMIFIIFILATTAVFAQTSVTYNASGYFTVPAGVTSVTIECWGAGGGGGGNGTTTNGGGGAGGGAFCRKNTISVTPFSTYAVNVGIGGWGGWPGLGVPGSAGGDSWFLDATTVLAKGGGGGYSPNGAGGVAGAGGLAASCIGDVAFSGGNGGAGRTATTGTGGGGGSSAGSALIGTNGTAGAAAPGAGGIAPIGGGDGGNGGGAANDGNPGFIPGGGGGGSGDGAAGYLGGDGASGKIIITYTCMTISTQPINQTLCSGGAAELNVISSAPGLSYQWKYNGINVSNGVPAGAIYNGNNSATLIITGAIAPGVYGNYTCVLSNTCGSLTSTTAQLTVNATAAPATPANPTTGTLACNVTITASGSPPGGVTWFWQGNNCGTSTVLGSGATYNTSNTGTYYLRARDNALGCWSISCGNVAVSALDKPTIITNPTNITGCNGTPVTFSVTAIGAALTYQWQEFNGVWGNLTNGGVYSGVTTEVLTISDPAGLTGRQYRCILTGTCAPTATSAAAILTVMGSGLSGTITVPGSYATLRLAFNAININGLSGPLDIQITASIADNNEAILNAVATCGNIGFPINIYPTGAGPWTLSGSNAISLFTLNGADNVTFNGRLNQVGAANNLIFSNTHTSGCTMKLVADACSNSFTNCDIRGVETSYSTGVIFFSSGSVTGNDNNLIDNCIIRDGASTPANGIFSYGVFGKENDNNTVSNCSIFNQFMGSGGYASGIDLEEGNARWTFTGNSFYQTANRVDCNYWPLFINCPSNNEFIVSNNYIGGTAALCGGGQMNFNWSGYTNNFSGITINVNNSGISSIENNVIKNILWRTVPFENGGVIYTRFAAIGTDGRTNVINNTIGDAATGSIVITMDDNGLSRAGITAIIKGGDGMVLNNKIGSISINGACNDQCLFNGIQITGNLINDVLISGNTLGHATTANSIQATSAVPRITFGGIYFGTAGNYQTTVSNNLIANVTLTNTSTTPFCVGLSNQATGGTQTIIGNTIRNISTLSTNTTFTDMPALAGIVNNNSTTGGITIAQNTIHSLTASGVAAVTIFGIYCQNAVAGPNNISKNFIHSLASSFTGSYNIGIEVFQGSAIISNNRIRLGINSAGASIGTDGFFVGIWKEGVSPVSTYFNSVYIGGNAGVGTRQSYGYARITTGVDACTNNIFYNARTSAGSQFAIAVNNTTTFTSNYNDLFSANAATLGTYNLGTTPLTYAAWRAGPPARDANSINLDPIFSNPTGDATSVSLDLQITSPDIGIGFAGTGILVDYSNQTRKTGISPNGPCIGADEVILTPIGANAYGIYAPAALSGTIEDCEIYATGGAPGGVGTQVADPLNDNWANVGISTYQTITASNFSCTNSPTMTFTTTDASPDWLFGNGSAPSTGSLSPLNNVQYSTTGRKNIFESYKLYRDFVNITMDTPDPGLILGAPAGAGCPTTYSYTSSVSGSPGFTYFWTIQAPGGCSATITSPNSSTTDVTFINTTGYNQVFVLTLTITTECCGPLERVIRYITIYPSPLAPTVSGTTFALCTGGSQGVSVTGPDPTYSYEWYDASTGGALLGTGTSFTVDPVLSGTNSYWVQATNSYGCASPRTEVQITGNDTPAPTVAGASTCGVGDVTLSVNSPLAGATYNWYSGSCGGTLMQTSTSTSFTTSIAATTTFYVEVIPVGCGVSTCSAPVGTFITPPNPIVWLGAVGGLNNWFNAANWSSGCIPTCATNVRIPNLAIDPDIGFSATGDAACQDMDLQASAILSFSDTKAVLNICGNVTHSGVVTTGSVGLVKFMGSTAQTYSRTGSGDFHNVTLENSAATPTLTISNDLALDATGIFEFVSGKVVTGANYLVIKNTDVASILGHSLSSYVNGNLRRYVTTGAYDLPLGNTNAYELANIDITSNTGLSYLNTNFTNPANATGSGLPLLEATLSYDAVLNCGGINAATGHANGGVWTITPDAGTANYAMTLFGRNWDNAGTGHIVIRRVTAGPGAWTLAGTQVSNSNAGGLITSERSTYAGFSQFSIARTNDVLPVTMMSFTASCDNTSVDLRWATASETNSDFFAIERSANADIWEHIGNVDAAGNSNSARYYSYIDNDAFAGTNYYRLKQTDYNGGYKYYGPLSISCEDVVSPGISYYPNPFTSEIMVEVSNLVTDEASIIVYDAIGKKILEQKLSNISESNHKFTLDLGSLATGVYTVQFGSDVFSHYSKIVKY